MTLACGVTDNLRIVKHLSEIVIIFSILTQWQRGDPDWSLLPETACKWESANSGDFPDKSHYSPAPQPTLPLLRWAPPGGVRCSGLRWASFTPQQRADWLPLFWINGSPSSVLKFTFTLAWSKHHRARKGLNSTKATLLFRQRFFLRTFYISVDLFCFFHLWADSVRRGNYRMEGT